MALPEKVIDALSQEKPDTVGWSWRIFLFSLFVLILSLVFYAGLNWGYKIYLNNRLKNLDNELTQLQQQANQLSDIQLSNFYSRLINIKKLFDERKSIIPIFSWLENKIHKDVTLTRLNFNSSSNQMSLNAIAKSKETILEQMLIFQRDENVENVILKSFGMQGNNNWQFSVDVYLKPSLRNLSL